MSDKWVEGTDAWSRSFIELATPERLAEIAEERRETQSRRRVIEVRRALAAFIFNDLAPDEIESLYAQMRNNGMPEVPQ
jgi:hypothetical protein